MPYTLPEELYYTKNHEWLQVDENLVTIGLTEHAIDQLGEVIYLDFPEDGQHANQGQALCSIESILKIHDILSSINGTVLEVNSSLVDDPTLINDDPMGEGWLFRVELDNERDLANLLRSKDYKELLETSSKNGSV
ncbi:glycine cleavage system protein GcvH [Bdellovibrio svalbardensis]|uniref:Glycine cleavage system H protein n=1 Tax=Bdellovibrio svalbardensis TaxID=2972972 RepID=A0ABT6DN31_9BACT|nr:glycine cleavage system protein GcvH [Bdellovibrio svalbardensis]MDG0818188.1 glycine cleavage system protein GcvH [Bdellovibrio svalbardensis]